MCFFYHAGHSALCNFQTSSDSHYWASTAKHGLQYMCAKVDATEFQVQLQARNGVLPTKWAMIAARINSADSNTNDMSATMRATCTAIGSGWKPICDHPSYCKSDSNSFYLGQDHHLAYPHHRRTSSYMPSGWTSTQWGQFDNKRICMYSGASGGNYQTLCDTGSTHEWRRSSAGQYIGCAKLLSRVTPSPTPFPTASPTAKPTVAFFNARRRRTAFFSNSRRRRWWSRRRRRRN
jgi:hypothetical protein